MNILVLNYEFPPLGGGAAPVSQDIAVELHKRGHQISVITMGYEGLPEYEELYGISIYRVRCIRKSKNVCKPWEQYSYLFMAKKFLRRHMQDHTYEVCHVHFIVPTGELATWVKKKYGIPYIITAHGSDVEGHNTKITVKMMHHILRPIWRKIVRESYRVISPSVYLKELMEHNYAGEYYQYIPNGIHYNMYEKIARDSKKEHHILIMGRLQQFKNVQFIIKALAMIDLQDWQVDVLGDGPYREQLEKLAADVGLAGQIKFYGWIDHGSEEQLSFLKKASIYISASEFENCPMAVIEAAAAGCQILLSDIPAHNQLISESRNFFPLNDVAILAERIRDYIENDRGEAGVDVSRYNWTSIVTKYEKILGEAGEAG